MRAQRQRASSAVPSQWESDGWGARYSPAGMREGRVWCDRSSPFPVLTGLGFRLCLLGSRLCLRKILSVPFVKFSEQPLWGRPMFTREVRSNFPHSLSIYLGVHGIRTIRSMSHTSVLHAFQEKIGMAMVGQGLVAGPPPRRLAYHSSFGQTRIISSMLEM
jgi:hypothetical protein